jgi:hypothetical protein
LPSCFTSRRTSRRPSAVAVSDSLIARHSERALRRNLSRAGTLWNSALIDTVVPAAAGDIPTSTRSRRGRARQCRRRHRWRSPVPARRRMRSPAAPRREAEAADLHEIGRRADLGRTVPLEREERVLPVHAAPVVAHPDQRGHRLGYRHRDLRAPASSAFSTSSFTTDAGRSTTSPAAIWSATSWGESRCVGTRKSTSLYRAGGGCGTVRRCVSPVRPAPDRRSRRARVRRPPREAVSRLRRDSALWRRLRLRLVGAAAPASTAAPAASTTTAGAASQRQLVVPLRIEVGRTSQKHGLVIGERAVERRFRRVVPERRAPRRGA